MITFFEYTLSLQAPAVIHDIGGDPNSASTMRFIPGSMIRGAIAAILGDPKDDPKAMSTFQNLVLSGKVRYLNAYPVENGTRTLPAPVCFRVAKGALGKDLKVTDLSGYDEDEIPDEILKRFPDAFLDWCPTPVRVRVKTGVSFHHQRDRLKGRAWQEKTSGGTIAHGTVYSYEFIREGQTFAGRLAIEGANEADISATIAEIAQIVARRPTLLLGRSRRAQYGGAAPLLIDEKTGCPREIGRGRFRWESKICKGDHFRIMLTAAAIVRDPVTGQLDPSAIAQVLISRLNGKIVLDNAWLDFDVIGGYNQKWALPMPQSPAVKAGSILRFKALEDIAENDWLALESSGIGERRIEGMGAILFLRDCSDKTLMISEAAHDSPNVIRPSVEPPLIVTMQKEILRKELTKIACEQAFAMTKDARNIPAGSLIGRLRLPLRGDRAEALSTFQAWLSDDAGTQNRSHKPTLKDNARRQLKRCRLKDKTPLFTWFQNFVQATTDIALKEFQLEQVWKEWTLIDADFAKAQGKTLLEDIKILYLDAVLAGLARKKREGREA